MNNPMNELNVDNLRNKVKYYHNIMENTKNYRQIWHSTLKDEIRNTLQSICESGGLKFAIEDIKQFENLDALLLTLGNVKSGIYQKMEPDIEKHLIRHNGSLVYQQLFNGKIIVLINYPIIENYMEPRPPKTIAIYRPEEIKTPFILRHVETLISEITAWEDYDDDEEVLPAKIGFNHSNYRVEEQLHTNEESDF